MFQNYLKTALRNLMRNKLFSFINIAGLAVGLAAFILILLFVHDEMSWDKTWDRGADTYRVESTILFPVREDRPTPNAVAPLKAIMLDTYPEIEDITRHIGGGMTFRQGETLAVERSVFAEPNHTAFFGYDFIEGSADGALADQQGIVITERLAKKYFGDAPAMGQTMEMRLSTGFEAYYVAGVIADLPRTTHMSHDVILPFARRYFEGARWFTDDWRFTTWTTYVRFKEGTDVSLVQADLPALVERHMPKDQVGQETGRDWGMRLDLRRLDEIHLYGNDANADPAALYGFVAIAFLILAIAVVNFLNLSMARTANRAREVAMRKIVGAGRRQIVEQFLGESVLLAVIALTVSLVLVEAALPYYNDFLTSVIDLDLGGQPLLVVLLVLLGIAVGLSAGSFQAVFFSLLKPRDVVYSNTASDNGTSGLRQALVIGQFTISVALMTFAFFVKSQTDYARSLDLGFNPNDLIVVAGTNNQNGTAFKNRILESPYVLAVGRSSDVPTEGSEDRLQMRPVTGGEKVTLDGLPTDPDFFRAYQIPLIAGRYLTTAEQDTLRQREENPAYKDAANIVVNASGARLLGFASPEEAVGQVLPVDLRSDHVVDARIVGVVEDFHFDSARNVIRPGIYYIDYLRNSDMSVRIDGPNRELAINDIQAAWREIFPNQVFNYRVMSDLVDQQYQTDSRLGDMLTVFTLLAITISCMGLYGLASFTVERRTKEIGVRKVLGARLVDIVRLLLWQFAKPILIATLIAWPVAFYFINDWLSAFAYRVELNVLPFLATGALALFIGWVTVAGHAFLVARANPIRALRYE